MKITTGSIEWTKQNTICYFADMGESKYWVRYHRKFGCWLIEDNFGAAYGNHAIKESAMGAVERQWQEYAKQKEIRLRQAAEAKAKIDLFEEDGGLWIAYPIGNNAEDRCQIGAVFDQGSKCAMQKPTAYDALTGWDGCVPMELIGTAKTWQGAIKILRQWIANGRQSTGKLPDYHPDYKAS